MSGSRDEDVSIGSYTAQRAVRWKSTEFLGKCRDAGILEEAWENNHMAAAVAYTWMRQCVRKND